MLIKDLYAIQSFEFEDHTLRATIKLNQEHAIFEGHFPGNPVMPGVCMIQIIKELTERAVEKELFLSIASNIKFMALINPEKNATLQLILVITEVDEVVKVKNTTSFNDTLALKLSATFKVIT